VTDGTVAGRAEARATPAGAPDARGAAHARRRRRGGARRASRERGSGTVFAVACVGALLICLVGGLTVVAAVHAAHTARAAADLAALAAAAAVQQGAPVPSACTRAGELAAANGGVLVSCAADPSGRVSVEVGSAVDSPLPAPALGSARARARAGTWP